MRVRPAHPQSCPRHASIWALATRVWQWGARSGGYKASSYRSAFGSTGVGRGEGSRDVAIRAVMDVAARAIEREHGFGAGELTAFQKGGTVSLALLSRRHMATVPRVDAAAWQLRVLIVQPDPELGAGLVYAMSRSGHDAVTVSVASWAVPLVRAQPPDVVVLERRAPGFESLVKVLERLNVRVAVLITRLLEVPQPHRWLDAPLVACLVRHVEDAATVA